MGEQLSAAFFCPQSRAPDEEYLAGLHSFLLHNTYGQFLLDEIAKLDDTWTLFASARADVRALSHGPVLVDLLRDWATSGQSGPLAAARSGIVALPLLVVLQIGQYLRYLEAHNVSHSKIVADVQNAGGLQGYCGGLPSAIAIAAARDEHEVVRNTVIVMRVVLGVGAYGEAADNTRGTGATTLALRLKYEGQGDDLVRGFPGVCTHLIFTRPQKNLLLNEVPVLIVFVCVDVCFRHHRSQINQHCRTRSPTRRSIQPCLQPRASSAEDGYSGESAQPGKHRSRRRAYGSLPQNAVFTSPTSFRTAGARPVKQVWRASAAGIINGRSCNDNSSV